MPLVKLIRETRFEGEAKRVGEVVDVSEQLAATLIHDSKAIAHKAIDPEPEAKPLPVAEEKAPEPTPEPPAPKRGKGSK